ncbi:MAG TPA: hypothetical protein VJB90_00930 [Candidatus Nanoarchaeia archaeon]|nr:hypothetical protein [Candidatus Nanoarchaeia archaeon]
MAEVRCDVCARLAKTALYVRLHYNLDSEKGWMCQECYEAFWNMRYTIPIVK